MNSGMADFGGGFMTGGDAGFGSPSAPRPQKRIQSIVPCSCSMLHKVNQDGDRHMLGPVELGQVTLIAKIQEVKPGNSYIEYELNDDSGETIMAKQFIEGEDDKSQHNVGSLVRVFGSLRTFQGKQSLVAFSIRPVTDMNEHSLHLIEVTHAHAVLTRNAQGGGKMEGSATGGTYPQPAAGFSAQSGVGGLSSLQSQVQRVIASTSNDFGMSVAEVCSSLRGVPENGIKDAIEFLSNEGHIYSTIDEDHYKATDC